MYTANTIILFLGVLAMGVPTWSTWIPRSHQWSQEGPAIRHRGALEEPASIQEDGTRNVVDHWVGEEDEDSTECIKQALVWLLEENIAWTKRSRPGLRGSGRSGGALGKGAGSVWEPMWNLPRYG